MVELTRHVAGQKIVVQSHNEMHFDEIAALDMFEENVREYGLDEFMNRYCPDGVLKLGFSGGAFDHLLIGKPLCCCVMMARALNLLDDSSWKPILDFAKKVNFAPMANPFDMASVIKALNRQHPQEPERVIEWAQVGLAAKRQTPLRPNDFTLAYIALLLRVQNSSSPELAYDWFQTGLEAKCDQQQKFLAGEPIFKNDGEIRQCAGPDGGLLKIAIIASDNDEMHNYILSGLVDADVATIFRSTGHVQIFLNHPTKLTLHQAARIIRLKEQEKRGRVLTANYDLLGSNGTLPEVKEWHLHAGVMFLNSSHSYPDVPVTRLTKEEIIDSVVTSFAPDVAFNEDVATDDEEF